MSKTMFVAPTKGRQVRDPRDGKPLPVQGAKVDRTAYWMRRLKDGDVTLAKPPRVTKTEKEG